MYHYEEKLAKALVDGVSPAVVYAGCTPDEMVRIHQLTITRPWQQKKGQWVRRVR